MEWIHELIAWIVEQDWTKLAKAFKLVADYKDIIAIAASLLAAAMIFFISRSMKKTISGLRSEIKSAKLSLDGASSDFRDRVLDSAEKLKTDFTKTVETLDASVQKVLSKRIEFLQVELNRIVTDEILPKLATSAATGLDVLRGEPERDYWVELRELWEQSKTEVDFWLEEAKMMINDRRRTKKYDHPNKKIYDKFIYKLFEDNIIDDASCDALLEMNLIFNSRRNRKRIVSLEDMERFRELRVQWLAAVPIEKVRTAA